MATSIVPQTEPGAADVYRAISQVQKAISKEGIAKGRKNQQQGYGFRGIDDIYNSLSNLLAVADLCILPRMLERTQQERPTQKGGTLFFVAVKADFDFVSARDGSIHTVTMFGEAMDSADKATNKAMSAAYKYAAMQVFCIPTEGMPDADATTPEPVAPRPKLVKPQPVVARIEELPEYEYEEVPEDSATLEEELRQSIIQAEKARPHKRPAHADMVAAFGELRRRYHAIRMDHTFGQFLAFYGFQSPEEFPDTEEGMKQARECFKRMSLDVANREVKGRS